MASTTGEEVLDYLAKHPDLRKQVIKLIVDHVKENNAKKKEA